MKIETDKSIQKSEISRWWNNERNKRWDNFFEGNNTNSYRMNMRANTVLKLLNQIGKQKLKIFEIGFGAGQIAKMILELGHFYHGIDVSQTLTDYAIQRNKIYVEKSLAKFEVGSIDENLKVESKSYDVVLAVGVLQYSTNLEFTINELKRVLKDNGHIIICQTNMYDIQRMFSFRRILIRTYYLLSNYQFEITPSFYSLLFETNLNKKLKLNQNNNFFNNKFFKKNYEEMKYNFKKNLMYVGRIKSLFKKDEVDTITYIGSPFFYSKNIKFLKKLDYLNKIIFFILLNFKLNFLFRFADNVSLLMKKTIK